MSQKQILSYPNKLPLVTTMYTTCLTIPIEINSSPPHTQEFTCRMHGLEFSFFYFTITCNSSSNFLWIMFSHLENQTLLSKGQLLLYIHTQKLQLCDSISIHRWQLCMAMKSSGWCPHWISALRSNGTRAACSLMWEDKVRRWPCAGL